MMRSCLGVLTILNVFPKSSDLQWWLRSQKCELSFLNVGQTISSSQKVGKRFSSSEVVRMRTSSLPQKCPLHILLLLLLPSSSLPHTSLPSSSLPLHTNLTSLPRFHKSSLLLAVSQVRDMNGHYLFFKSSWLWCCQDGRPAYLDCSLTGRGNRTVNTDQSLTKQNLNHFSPVWNHFFCKNLFLHIVLVDCDQ